MSKEGRGRLSSLREASRAAVEVAICWASWAMREGESVGVVAGRGTGVVWEAPLVTLTSDCGCDCLLSWKKERRFCFLASAVESVSLLLLVEEVELPLSSELSLNFAILTADDPDIESDLSWDLQWRFGT